MKRCLACRQRTRRAFSRAELVLLAGTAALLIAIGLARIKPLRTDSQNSVCQSRLRALSQGFLAYQSAEGRMPTSGRNSRLWPTDWLHWQTNRSLGQSAVAQHVASWDADILRCPLDRTFDERRYRFSYTMNERLERMAIKNYGPAGAILLAEEVAPNDGSWAPGNVDDQLTTRHNGHGNVAFGDGHVQEIHQGTNMSVPRLFDF